MHHPHRAELARPSVESHPHRACPGGLRDFALLASSLPRLADALSQIIPLAWLFFLVAASSFVGPQSSIADTAPAAKTFSASGTLVRENGTPVANATVWLRRYCLEHSSDPVLDEKDVVLAKVTSAEDGRFFFREIPHAADALSHSYFLMIRPNDGAISWRAIDKRHVGKAPHDFGRIVIKPSAKVRGHLLTSDRKPLAGVRVHAMDIDSLKDLRGDDEGIYLGHTEASPRVTTDAEGRFEMAGLPAGYRVKLQVETSPHSGPVLYAATTDQPQPGIGEKGEIPVHSQQFSAVLPKGKTLRGHVTFEESRKPASRATLTLCGWWPADTRHGYIEVTADDQGAFEIPGIHFQGSNLIVKPPRDAPYVGFHGDITISKEITERNFVLPRGVPVKGLVQDQATEEGISGIAATYFDTSADNWPLPEHKAQEALYATIDAQLGEQSYLFSPARTNSRGEFTLLGLKRLGIVHIHGRAPTYWLPPRDGMVSSIGRFERYSRPNVRTPLLFELNHGLTVQGRVTDPAGRSLVGARVIECPRSNDSLWLPTEASAETVTDANGRYVLTAVAPDTAYTHLLVVHEQQKLKLLKLVRELPYDVQRKSEQYPNGMRIDYKSDGSRPAPALNIDLQPTRVATVTARVLQAGKPGIHTAVSVDEQPSLGVPPEGEWEAKFAGMSGFSARPWDPPLQPQTSSDAQGNVTIENLVPGWNYTITISAAGARKQFAINNLKPGEQRSLGTLNFPAYWKLKIILVDAAGKPVPKFRLYGSLECPPTPGQAPSKGAPAPPISIYSRDTGVAEESLYGDALAITLEPVSTVDERSGGTFLLNGAPSIRVPAGQTSVRIVLKRAAANAQ